MTDDRSLERAARSWLETGPTEAPDPAVEAALLQIQTTNQERDWHVPWRTRPMNQTTRLLAGAAAIAVVLLGGVLLLRPGTGTGPGAPTTPPPSSPTASTGISPTGSAQAILPLTEKFTSARHGFAVYYPSGWMVKPATKSWPAGQPNTWGSGMNDELSTGTARFSGASQPLAAGQTADQWMTTYANGADTSSWQAVTIGGQPGKIDYDGGPAAGGTITPGGVMFDAVVVTGNRAYNFNMDGKLDRTTFEAFVATVTFDPASAVGPVPDLSESFTSTRHGFSIDYPSSWTARAATAPWPPGTDGGTPPDPMLDMFTEPSSTTTFVVVSQPLATGVTADSWLTAYEASAATMPAACWPVPDNMEHGMIDGQPAWIHGGRPECSFTEAIVFAGGRVYELTAYFPVGGAPTDRGLFDALLATVKLDPAAADDSPTASTAP